MKVMVAYASRTGNTKKVAEAVFQEVQAEKEIKELSAVSDLAGYDLVFVGLPIIAFGPAPEAKDFLAKHCQGKKVAMFVTHASPEDLVDLQGWLGKCREAAAGADLIGLFDCQGELAQNVKDLLLKSNDPKMRAWAETDASKGQPDVARLERARVFARQTMAAVK